MDWDDVSRAWAQVWASVEASWSALYQDALKAWGPEIQKDPGAFEPKVEAWMAELKASRANLDRIKALIPSPPVTGEDHANHQAYLAMETRYHELAAGFYGDTRMVEGPPVVGIVPVLIIAGLAIGVGGTAWAVAAYEYAVSLREQTGLAADELEARIAASKDGRQLPQSTLPGAVPEPMSPQTKSYIAFALLAVTAGAFTLPILLKR